MAASHLLDGIEWVLFDAVGTLIYPDPPVAHVYYVAGQQYGSRLSADEIRVRFREALAASQSCGEPTNEERERSRWRQIVRGVFDDVTDGAEPLFETLWHHFARPQNWRTYDDVATLGQLRTRGYRVGIASNFDSRLIDIVSSHPPLAACEAVFVSSTVGFTKPDQRFFRAIEKQLGITAGKIALIGDDEIADIQGAAAVGWRTFRLARGNSNPAELSLRSLAELL